MITHKQNAPCGANEVGVRVALAQDVWGLAAQLNDALWRAAYAGVQVRIECRERG